MRGILATRPRFPSCRAKLLSFWMRRSRGMANLRKPLVTLEAEASGSKAELDSLKEQATKWEVDIAWLNADLANKLSNPLTFTLPDISCPTYHQSFWHNNHADIYSYF
jgi:hypothetical protein